MLTRRSALMVQLESTYDTLPSFNAATDGLWVDAPAFTADMQMLDRKLVKPSISAMPHLVGRKQAKLKFTAELNLNDLANTGNSSNAPIISRLLQGCGMAQTAEAATWVSPVLPQTSDANAACAWSSSVSGNYVSSPIVYLVTCTSAGGSGTAQVSITPHNTALDSSETGVTVTNTTPISVGTHGATITPTVAEPLVVGQQWLVGLFPPGLLYKPVSTNFQSVAFQFFVDGSLHKMTGCYGTFTLKADAGMIVTADFDFTGRYQTYVDQSMPSITYPNGNVPVFKSAGVAVGTFSPTINSMTLDIGNAVTNRMSANATDGYYGVLITDRAAKMGLDPEATNAATQDFWDTLAGATDFPVFANIGSTVGSRVFLFAPKGQYSGLTYKDRNGVRAHDASVTLAQVTGDDEIWAFLY
jgi:uncharacterized protein YdbL (DUF1318 family)